MTILENIETPVGPVSAVLMKESEYETWCSEHRDRCVVDVEHMVLVVHSTMPKTE